MMKNRILLEWNKEMKRGVTVGVITIVMALGFVLILTMLNTWYSLLLLPALLYGGWYIAAPVRSYHRKMAVWLALPDETRRVLDALCAEERQTAYCHMLRGYLTPHGMLLREGFFAWEHIVSIGFWEKGRKFSRAADWWNLLTGAVGLFGRSDPDYVDPESPAQCRITVREGAKERVYCLGLPEQSFSDGGVEQLIAELRASSPVELKFY